MSAIQNGVTPRKTVPVETSGTTPRNTNTLSPTGGVRQAAGGGRRLSRAVSPGRAGGTAAARTGGGPLAGERRPGPGPRSPICNKGGQRR